MSAAHRRSTCAVMLTAALTLTGCTTVVFGAARRDPGFDPSQVQVELLETGNYPTKPQPPMGTVISANAGRRLEGDRMADNVVMPYDVDSALTNPVPMETVTIKDAESTSLILPDPIPTAPTMASFIVGFSSARNTTSGPYKELCNFVLEFPDPAAAGAAATEIAAMYANPATDQSLNNLGATPQAPLGIPRHPDALGSTSEDQFQGAPAFTVSSFTAHGPYVLFQRAVTTDRGASADLVARTLDMQAPLIDTFVPVPPDQFAAQPADPTGLLARTLPVGEDAHINENAVYAPAGFMHFADDPAKFSAAFTAAGVQSIAFNDAIVYQASDAPAAKGLAATIGEATARVEGTRSRSTGPRVTRRPSATSTRPTA